MSTAERARDEGIVTAQRAQPATHTGERLVIDLRGDGAPTIDLPPIVSGLAGMPAAPPWQLALKRWVDLIGATVIGILVSPILVAAAVAVKSSSRGPLFYRSERVGRGGERFTFYKFRSMEDGADERRDPTTNEAAGPIYKVKIDPRCTAVGRFLRRTSIDELPQLWNVIRGEMSLVGPRPPLPCEVEEYGTWEWQRLLVTPGITGIWQVSGRSDLDFETWVRMDIEYIETWSPWLDIKLLARTVPAVLSGRGAY